MFAPLVAQGRVRGEGRGKERVRAETRRRGGAETGTHAGEAGISS
jgi:hypothetical protein